MKDLFLGLDLGTSSCKLIAFDETGHALAEAAHTYPVLNTQPGFFELDADYVWKQAVTCFHEVGAADLPGRVRTLAISVLGEAMVPVDRHGQTLGPAQISADMRCLEETACLTDTFGDDYIHSITGQPVSPIYSLPKLMWCRKHQPTLIKSAWKFLCFGEFALLRLGMPPIIDEGMASRTLMFDMKKRHWSKDMMSCADIHIDQLSDIGRSGDVVGVIHDTIADTLALPSGVVVILGGHDQAMGALGAGITSPGTAMYSIGTTEALVIATDAPSPAFGHHNIPCSAHVVKDLYTGLAGNQSGGRVLTWYRGTMGLPAKEDMDAISIGDMFNRLEDTLPTWPILLPHLLGSGSVLNDHHSLGAMIGLRFDTRREDIFLSLLEGVTFEQALSLQALETGGRIHSVRAIGGGAQSDFWLQMKADILNRPVTRVTVGHAPCLAAAILGCAAMSGDRIEDLATRMIRTDRRFNPRSDRHALHKTRLELYRELYKALIPINRRLAS